MQVSGFFMGGDANDVRFRPEARFYIPLWRNGVLAGRAGTGLLCADNYAATQVVPPAISWKHLPWQQSSLRKQSVVPAAWHVHWLS